MENKGRLGTARNVDKPSNRKKICVAVVNKSEEGKSGSNVTKDMKKLGSGKREICAILQGKYKKDKGGLGAAKSIKNSGGGKKTYFKESKIS